jgi:lysophospholipase L1-like esterase
MNTHHVVRITAFGSSSTKGVGASSPATNYPSRLQGDLAAALPAGTQVVVTNRGIGGEDAEDMMRRLPAVLAEHPDLLIWQTGTNDPLRGLPLPRFIELTRAGLTAIRAAGVDAMLMEPQDCPVFAGKPGALAYRDAVRSLAAEFGIPVVRRYDLMQTWLTVGGMTPKQLEAPDGLHMSDTGYALLARAVAQTILTGLPKAAPRAVVTVATLEPKF